MSKCVKCGNEILTGDIHWEMGLCNSCYNELYKDHKTHISLDKMWLKIAQDFRGENEKLQDKVADLEAKLAEKKEEFKWLHQKFAKYVENNQDKISFSVEQLEKVKEYISSGLAFDIDVQIWFEEYIDNQIEELKKEMK